MEDTPKPSISYTGVVLDEKSRAALLIATVGLRGDSRWHTYAHHMTINMGPLYRELNPHIEVGMEIGLTATHYGLTDKVIAVKVDCPGVKTTNAVPHVTVAVNKDNGGKPKHSNDIPEESWVAFGNEANLFLGGIVTEVPNPTPMK